MIRSDKFLISQHPFALDLATFRDGELHERNGGYSVHARINAVWFRRKSGETRACIGELGLWSQCLKEPVDPTDAIAVLTADLDSRYGGDCHARWDGERYWGAQQPDVMAEHLELLRPMLANYPAIPAGLDGWWRF